MKIVHIALSGTFTEHFNYHENELPLAQRRGGNNDVLIIARNQRREKNKIIHCQPGAYVIEDGIRLIRVKVKQSRINVFVRPNSREILNILEREKPDMIWVHGIMNSSLSIACRYKKRYPDCVLFADNHVDLNNFRMTPLKKAGLTFFRIRNRRLSPQVDLFYGVTPGRVSFMKDYLGVPAQKAKLSIMGGLDEKINFSNKALVRNEVRVRNGIPEDSFLFVTGGKIDQRKKTLELMRVFHSLDGANYRLAVFGSVAESVQNEFNELLSGDSRILFLGWKNDKECNDIFLAADCCVFLRSHSTLWENALACGVPCIFGQKKGFEHLFHNLAFSVEGWGLEEIKGLMKSLQQNETYRLMRDNCGKNRIPYLYSSISNEIFQDYYRVRRGQKNAH